MVTSQQSNLSRHRTEASPSMGAWQGPLANGWHQQPKAVTRRSTANIAQLNQGSPSQTLKQRLRVALEWLITVTPLFSRSLFSRKSHWTDSQTNSNPPDRAYSVLTGRAEAQRRVPRWRGPTSGR